MKMKNGFIQTIPLQQLVSDMERFMENNQINGMAGTDFLSRLDQYKRLLSEGCREIIMIDPRYS